VEDYGCATMLVSRLIVDYVPTNAAEILIGLVDNIYGFLCNKFYYINFC
jgi:hypothetical protein